MRKAYFTMLVISIGSFTGAPSTIEFKKLRKRLVRNVHEAILQYGVMERDARWRVGLSGGKDSEALWQYFMN